MCPARPPSLVLGEFKAQLLRWNPQINLISRQSTEQRIDDLIIQALAGADVVAGYLRPQEGPGKDVPARPLIYFDIGSGGGIPGIVWHSRLSELGFIPTTCLVEPRTKRAWFLERQGQIPGMRPFTVLCQRWGDVLGEYSPFRLEIGPSRDRIDEAPNSIPRNILISLKALKLTDRQVLAGLSGMISGLIRGDRRLVISRYYPPGQALDTELSAALGISAPGRSLKAADLVGTASRSWADPLPGPEGPCASLVFSEYFLHNS